MDVVTPQEMKCLEQESGLSFEAMMEQAGEGIAQAALQMLDKWKIDREENISPSILLLVGKGNNGGDAYVAGRYLLQHLLPQGLQVSAWQLEEGEKCSKLNQLNCQRFKLAAGKVLEGGAPPASSEKYHLIIDGLFGTGFKGEVSSVYQTAINWANRSSIPILAVDIPSGVDGESGQASGAIQATHTLCLGRPKIGQFLGEGWNVSGSYAICPIGLSQSSSTSFPASFEMFSLPELHSMLPPIVRTRHKYQIGPVAIWAGSPAMVGASVLASLAAYRAGAGMVKLFHPEELASLLLPLEIVRELYHLPNSFADSVSKEENSLSQRLNEARSILIGPGLALTETTSQLLKEVLSSVAKPCVLDASALTLMAKEGLEPPKGAILTPHLGEFRRLAHLDKEDSSCKDVREILACAKDYAECYSATLILKGSPTFIFHPQAKTAISTAGDPGMATAGSGDVLAGIVAALLAQGCSARNAAILGCHLHGVAGECAALKKTSYSLMASDLMEFLPQAFQRLTN